MLCLAPSIFRFKSVRTAGTTAQIFERVYLEISYVNNFTLKFLRHLWLQLPRKVMLKVHQPYITLYHHCLVILKYVVILVFTYRFMNIIRSCTITRDSKTAHGVLNRYVSTDLSKHCDLHSKHQLHCLRGHTRPWGLFALSQPMQAQSLPFGSSYITWNKPT